MISQAETELQRGQRQPSGRGADLLSKSPLLDATMQPRIRGEGQLGRKYRAVGVGLAVSDSWCAVLALVVAHLSLYGSTASRAGLLWLTFIVFVVWLASFHAFGLYAVRNLSPLEEFRRLISATCVATCLVTVVRAWSKSPIHRKWFFLTWVLALALELGTRRLWRWQVQRLRRNGPLAARTLILGTNAEAARIGIALRRPELGFRLIGHLATTGEGNSQSLLPVIGQLEELDETVRSLGIECVFVASSAVLPDDLLRVAQVARRSDVEVRVSANLTDVLTSRVSVQRCDGLLALVVKPVRMSAARAFVKRAFDVSLATLLLAFSLPLIAAIAIAVRLSSPGPILFRQDRVTKDGRVFRMAKFRTMFVNADHLGGGGTLDLTVPFFKLADDPRMTRVGRTLRRFSLDELPQIWHVIRGDLSLVGPRPLAAIQVAANPELLGTRHEVRAGITGWWQINGRSSVSADEAVRMDLFYIENWSLSLDLFILLKTISTVLSGRGAC